MYEIFIADLAMAFCTDDELESLPGKRFSEVIRYDGRPNLSHAIHRLESGAGGDVALVHAHPQTVFKQLVGMMVWEEAAGGIVINSDDVLLIYRRGSWDLPKGKCMFTETTEDCAVREVQEETGIKHVNLVRPVSPPGLVHPATMHIFSRKGRHVLKQTRWFEMATVQRRLRPERGEDIEEARWIDRSELSQYVPRMYRSLQGMMEQYVR